MTEYSLFWTTNDTGDGDEDGYTAAQWFELWRAMFAGATGADLGGVAPDYLNQLAVTNNIGSPVFVASGAALVYGVPYFNDAPTSITIPTPISQNRTDRIVLRADWSAQTVRAVRLAGTEGAGAPTLTQTGGSTWEISLATVLITPSGVVTVTDTREYLQLVAPLGVGTAQLADAAVATAKLADGAVTNAKLASMAAATVKGRASGAGTGAPVDLTAAQLVAIVATADGAGSGLDADLLDGQHASAFAASSHTHSGVYALNNHNHDSAYAATNHNHDSAYAATNHNHDSVYAATNHNHDTVYSSTSHTHGTATITDGSITNAKLANMPQGRVKGRAIDAGAGAPVDLTATELREIIKTADGAGTGLDADTVDGLHAAAFALTGHHHNNVYADFNHHHNDDYAADNHNHVGVYALTSHNHGTIYSPSNHHHNDLYSQTGHLHSQYALSNHLHNDFALNNHHHDGVYALDGHTHTGFASSSHTHTGFASSSHTHSGEYAVSGHVHAGFASSTHNHNGVYSDVNHHHNQTYAASGHTHVSQPQAMPAFFEFDFGDVAPAADIAPRSADDLQAHVSGAHVQFSGTIIAPSDGYAVVGRLSLPRPAAPVFGLAHSTDYSQFAPVGVDADGELWISGVASTSYYVFLSYVKAAQ